MGRPRGPHGARGTAQRLKAGRGRLASAAHQRAWRTRTRARLVEEFGGYCGAGSHGFGCGANGGTRLEFAHKVPLLREPEEPNGTDVTLRNVRADPYAFMLLCRDCHHAYDGPQWASYVGLRP